MAFALILALGFSCLAPCANTAGAGELNLLPTPKAVKLTGGAMPLTAASRIVAADPALKPLAEIFSREILALTRLRLAPAGGEPKAGDIVLTIDPKLWANEDILTVQKRKVVGTRNYAHTIEVSDRAVVEGWDYRAVCEGTATLLQALIIKDGGASLPKMTVKDWPHADYTGIMIDCARQEIPIMALKDAVDAARFWKVRYLHLHVADDSALVFPLKCYPDAGKFNGAIHGGDTPKVWDRQELIKLAAYADARGVTLVPELETPGHCGSYQAAIGKLGDPGARMMDIANDSIYPVLDKIITEMCEVFKSSPYFHIGGDEIQWGWFINKPHVREYLKDHNMRPLGKGGQDDLLARFVLKLNEIVKRNGKKTIFWGGWQGPPQIAALNDCIVYSWFRGAKEAQKAGFTTITVPWEIKVPFEEWSMYHSNGEVLTKEDRVLGHSRPMWEMSAEELTRAWIDGMSERQERTWGPDTKMDVKEFRARERAARARMGRLVRPVTIKVDGDISPAGGVMTNKYVGAATITLTADIPPGCRIHYTLDKTEPAAKSPLYEKPFKHEGRLRLRTAMIDKAGERIGGITFSERYEHVGYEKSLSTGKPVETSGGKNPKEKPEFAVDGYADIGQFWGTIPAPQWLRVDLEKPYKIDRINVIPYWDYNRYYQYTVEVSADGKKWTQVVDASKNNVAGTEKGYVHKFKPVRARYVKINMLKNSDNPAVHVVELRVYEAAAKPM